MGRTLACPAFALALLAALASGVNSQAGTERNNWAVIVGTSRYWYNYRHASNILVFYHKMKQLGIPDSNIILMMAEDYACNARNKQPGVIWTEARHENNLYGSDVEVDYRGDEVSVENFLRLLTGRHPPGTPRSKRLLTDSMSNVFVYITGHSGDEFIKFSDWEEITSNDIADGFKQMYQQGRYKNVFWLSDTCQAATLQNQFDTPNIIAIGSSDKKENGYSHHLDRDLGVAIIDRFTYYAFHWMKQNLKTASSKASIQQFIDSFDPNLLNAHPQLRSDLYPVPASKVPMTDFLAAAGHMRFMHTSAMLAVGSDPLHSGPYAYVTGSCARAGSNDTCINEPAAKSPDPLNWQAESLAVQSDSARASSNPLPARMQAALDILEETFGVRLASAVHMKDSTVPVVFGQPLPSTSPALLMWAGAFFALMLLTTILL